MYKLVNSLKKECWCTLDGNRGPIVEEYPSHPAFQFLLPSARHLKEREELIFEHFQVPLNSLRNSILGASRGSRYMGLAAIMCAPWVLNYPYCHRMITQTDSNGRQRGL